MTAQSASFHRVKQGISHDNLRHFTWLNDADDNMKKGEEEAYLHHFTPLCAKNQRFIPYAPHRLTIEITLSFMFFRDFLLYIMVFR